MKLLCVFLLALALVIPASAAVVTHTYSVPAGWSLIALPGIPLYPEPPTVLNGFDLETCTLSRWEAATQSLITYDVWNPEPFRGMLLTDGYWFNATAPGTISYQGLNDNDSMDVWISLPKSGWTLMGNPFSRSYEWSNAKVTDGNITVSVTDAAYTYGWMSSVGYWWDNNTQSLIDMGVPDDFPSTTTMLPWHGVWLNSYVDKIALILESS